MKKLFSIILALGLTLQSLPIITANADEEANDLTAVATEVVEENAEENIEETAEEEKEEEKEAPVATKKPVVKEDKPEVKADLELIEYLEIIKNIDASKDSLVTRADFAVYVARILNIDEYSETNRVFYTDVPRGHWAGVSVNNLVQLGALKVDASKKFRPDDAITLEDATQIVLAVMGYMPTAESGNASYTSIARKLKLYENVKTSEDFTVKNAAIFLANALNADTYELTMKNGEAVYTQVEGRTLLSVYKNIYSIEGQVEVVNNTALYAGEELSNAIQIDGQVFKYTGRTDLIGCEVKAYYKSGKDIEDEVVLLFSQMDDNDVIEIDKEDFIGFDEDYVLSYYKKGSTGKATRINIPRESAFIYNGMAVDKDIVNLVNIDEGSLRLIRSKKTKDFDIVIIEEAEIVVAGYVDSKDKIVYDSADSTNMLNLSEDVGIVKIADASGNTLDIASITRNSVLAVYRSFGDYIEVIVSNQDVSGAYEGTVDIDGKKGIIVDGDEYIVVEKYYDEVMKSLTVGLAASFKLDPFGKIAAVSSATGTSDFIYAIWLSDSIAIDEEEEFVLKLYTQGEGIKTYRAADKLKVDGINYKKKAQMRTAFDASMDKSQEAYEALQEYRVIDTTIKTRLIRIRLNDVGKICEIDTPYKSERESEYTLQIKSAANDATSIYTGMIGYDMVGNSDTILYQIPREKYIATSTEKMYYVGGMKWGGDGRYGIGYTASPDKGTIDVFVESTAVKEEEFVLKNYLMVEKVERNLNEDDVVVETLYGWKNGAEVKFTVRSDAVCTYYDDNLKAYTKVEMPMIDSNVEPGDLMLYIVDAANEISGYGLIYDCSENKRYNPLSGSNKVFTVENEAGYGTYSGFTSFFNTSARFSYGYANDLKTNILTLSYEPGKIVREAYPVSGIKVTVYDGALKKNNIRTGSVSDITTYEDAGYDASVIIAYASYVVWQEYFVYKNMND